MICVCNTVIRKVLKHIFNDQCTMLGCKFSVIIIFICCVSNLRAGLFLTSWAVYFQEATYGFHGQASTKIFFKQMLCLWSPISTHT